MEWQRRLFAMISLPSADIGSEGRQMRGIFSLVEARICSSPAKQLQVVTLAVDRALECGRVGHRHFAIAFQAADTSDVIAVLANLSVSSDSLAHYFPIDNMPYLTGLQRINCLATVSARNAFTTEIEFG